MFRCAIFAYIATPDRPVTIDPDISPERILPLHPIEYYVFIILSRFFFLAGMLCAVKIIL